MAMPVSNWRVREKDGLSSLVFAPKYMGINIRSAPSLRAKTESRLKPGAVFEATEVPDAPDFLRLCDGRGYIPKRSRHLGNLLVISAAEEVLAGKLRQFYTQHKPSKLSEVNNIAKHFHNQQARLNEKLRATYGIDLCSNTTTEVLDTPVELIQRSESPSDASSPDPIPRAETPEEVVTHSLRTNLERRCFLDGTLPIFDESDYMEVITRGPTPDELRVQMAMESRSATPFRTNSVDEYFSPPAAPQEARDKEWVLMEDPVDEVELTAV